MTHQEFAHACIIAEQLVNGCDAEATVVARALLAARDQLGPEAFMTREEKKARRADMRRTLELLGQRTRERIEREGLTIKIRGEDG
jgi:hypothetical protein